MFRINVLLFFIVLFAYPNFYEVYAQGGSEDDKATAASYLEQAELIMESTQALDDARDIYALAAELDPENVVANYKAGDAFLQTINKDRAAQYFEKVLEKDPDYRFNIMYLIGRSYHYGMEFEKALDYYLRYRKKLLDQDGYRGRDKTQLVEVNRRIYECENAREFIANPAHYSIVNIGSEINSPWEDYAPVLNEDETQIVFTTRRQDKNLNENVAIDNKPYEDIFIATKNGDRWSYADNIGEVINTEFHDSNLALSADGKQLFIYKDDENGNIYTSEKNEDGTWTYPESLGESINSTYSENSVALSPNGKLLFFSSDRPGGMGEEGTLDLYVSEKDATGDWGRAKNLGPVINTEYDDDSPFLDYDGMTLYFSSKGRKGMGGYDIFKSTYDSANQEWTDPINMGYPINTPDNDIYFVSTKDGKRGYYSSVREDGEGYTDIYMVTIPDLGNGPDQLRTAGVDPLGAQPQEGALIDRIDSAAENTGQPSTTVAENTSNTSDESPDGETVATEDNISQARTPESDGETTTSPLIPVKLKVVVNAGDTGDRMEAKVGVRSKGDNIIAPMKRISSGIYEFTLRSNVAKQYQLSVEKSGYIFSNTILDIPAPTTSAQTIKRDITLRKFVVASKGTLRNIYFEFDKAVFTTESYNELNKLEKMLSENKSFFVEIGGHTDKIGATDYNKALSQRRANAVVDYLINKGIDSRRLSAVGYGAERPLVSNDDELEGREFNRRVEFTILKGK